MTRRSFIEGSPEARAQMADDMETFAEVLSILWRQYHATGPTSRAIEAIRDRWAATEEDGK